MDEKKTSFNYVLQKEPAEFRHRNEFSEKEFKHF